ncbi:MAG: BatA domain-containing protein [Gemmatimonadaceae bacterium]|nr:BatA domain-containing protein [Gemmatimonadaceae bacterium]
MILLAPWFMVAAIAAASGVVALHFLARQRPRAAILPTARFVPDRPARSAGRSNRPTDLILLALRVITVLLAGLAFARPVREPARRSLARVVAADVSRAAHPDSGIGRRALTLIREGDALVVFDSAARVIRGSVLDTLRMLERSSARGSLSAALIASLRARDSLSLNAERVELVLVSPLALEEWDLATASIRSLWAGPVRLEKVPAAAESTRDRLAIDFRGSGSDPLRASLALLGAAATDADVRMVRGTPTADDSVWAGQGDRVLVAWPPEVKREQGANVAVVARTESDTVGAVIAGDVVLVAPFARVESPPAGRVIARWVDGEPAATEVAIGAGCIRTVAVPVESRGDLALRRSSRDLVAALSAPCGGHRRFGPLPDQVVSFLAGSGSAPRIAPLENERGRRSPATPWLLGGALLAVALEPLARRVRETA